MKVPLNVRRFLDHAASIYPEKIGVIDQDGEFTYRQFRERAQRLSHALMDMGVGPGDRVAVLAYNNHPLLEAYYGVVQFGAVLVPLNIRLTLDEIAYIVGDCLPKVLLFDADFEGWAVELRRRHPDLLLVEIRIEGSHPGYQGYEEMLGEASPEPLRAEVDEDQVAEIFYTSGSTARPKGVALTHRSLYLHALQCGFGVGIDDTMVLLHTIPLFHVNGWGTPHYVTALGGTHVMLRRFVPAKVLELVERCRVTNAAFVPTMVGMLLQEPTRGSRDLSSLRQMNVGGAPSPSSFVAASMEGLGGEYLGGYGLSESSPVVSVSRIKSTLRAAPREIQDRLRGYAGLPMVGVEVRLEGPAGEAVPWDGESVGELLVQADSVMQGYWNLPEETESALRGGWLHTGDMAFIHPEGYIKIVDRKKDIIISGGENISSAEIEDVLYGHPAVRECAVVGRPDEKWGEVVHAAVSLKPGAAATPDELLAYARGRVAAFKAPRTLEIWDELPKTGTGKVLKTAIRRLLRQESDSGA